MNKITYLLTNHKIMNLIEERIKFFHKLTNNKWYYKYNYVLYEYMLLFHRKEKIIPTSLNDLSVFYDLYNKK